MKSRVLFLKDLKSLPLPRGFFDIKVNFHDHYVPWKQVDSYSTLQGAEKGKLCDELKDHVRIHLFFETKKKAFEKEFTHRIFPALKHSLTKYSSFYLDPVEYAKYRQMKLEQMRENMKKEDLSYVDYLHEIFDPQGVLFLYEMEKELEKSTLEEFKWKLYRDSFLECSGRAQEKNEESEEEKEQRMRDIVHGYCHSKAQYVGSKGEDF